MGSCWTTSRGREIKERKIWTVISVLFLGLEINKQLDLQTALTEAGRVLASQQGWYAQRQSVQVAFIIFVAIFCVGAVITLLIGARHAPPPTWLAILGTTSVFGYVLISCGVVPSHRPISRQLRFWFSLELDTGNGRHQRGASGEPVAPAQRQTDWGLSVRFPFSLIASRRVTEPRL